MANVAVLDSTAGFAKPALPCSICVRQSLFTIASSYPTATVWAALSSVRYPEQALPDLEGVQANGERCAPWTAFRVISGPLYVRGD